jgi:hypothetical protein
MSTNPTRDPPALRSGLEPLGSVRFEHFMQCVTVELARPGRSAAQQGVTAPTPAAAADVGMIGSPGQAVVARHAGIAGGEGRT